MGTTINISLIILATIVASGAISYFTRETGNWRHRISMLVMGFFVTIWCLGFALMGLTGQQDFAYMARTIGIIGANFFLITEFVFVLHISDAFSRSRGIIAAILACVGLLDTIFFSQRTMVTFLRNQYRTCYYAREGLARNLHYLFYVILFLSMFAVEARWFIHSRLRRDKLIIVTLIIANGILVVSLFPDSILPLYGRASFPSSCYGAFLCYMAIWYVSTQLNAFNISVRNLSNYIYQYVNASILVFDNDHKLAMANNYARKFLHIEPGTHPTLPDLFQISKEDADLFYTELLDDSLPEDIRVISNADQSICSLSLNLVRDSFGDPYCTVCFLYDLTKEEQVFNEVNEMKELLQADLKDKTYQVESLTLQSITTIANTIDAKDTYTKGHSIRVSEYSAQLAQALGWSKEAIQNLKYIALLHDIGKISVPDSILNKPDKLTDTEYEIIKSHTTVGGEILKDISMIKDVDAGARYHHERYDGKGYPSGLAGEEIPLVARIIGIADAYDAMNSKRIYRNPLPPETIRKELIRGRGTQFDPFLLDKFVELLDEGKIHLPNQRASGFDTTIANESSKLLGQILQNLEQEKERNSQCDYLTGLLNRKSGEEKIMAAMEEAPGALAFVDLDNLKPINDTMGHLSGDHALSTLAEVLQSHSHNAIIARIGGDEFLYYMQKVDEKEARSIVEGIIRSFRSKKDNDNILQLSSISIGLCLTTPADTYQDVYQNADKALYYVKQNGKDGYYFYSHANHNNNHMKAVDLKRLVSSISRQGAYEGSLGVEYREFAKFYEYINKLVDRYDQSLQLIMLTLEPLTPETFSLDDQEEAMNAMKKAISCSLRNVDITTRFSSEQFLIILLDANKENVSMITSRIFEQFYRMYPKNNVSLSYDVADLSMEDLAALN